MHACVHAFAPEVGKGGGQGSPSPGRPSRNLLPVLQGHFHFGEIFGMKGQKAVGISMSVAEPTPEKCPPPVAVKPLNDKKMDYSV